ncbi:hypothetical protein WMY93_007277 [Mugilogobius chulae]|uniref:Uncharacterized protein n=1 Tax=Mugilogobius chulae TaxID=88201 RepID=A0AAW0PPR4_9GOBI
MLPFIRASEIAYSCLADKCVDSNRYGIVQDRVANKCAGRPLYLHPLSGVFAKRRSQVGSRFVCLPLTKPDVTAGPFSWAKRQELYLKIHFSTSSRSLFSWSLWEKKPVSSGGRVKKRSICFCAYPSLGDSTHTISNHVRLLSRYKTFGNTIVKASKSKGEA